ncbi:MAG: acetyl-CoA carboxylase biotin carboxyl carrier protein [Candidatus Polarisedimenticolia bacterium]
MSGAVETIEALVERGGDGGWVVKAPRVGVMRGTPRRGARRTAGDPVGRLFVLDRIEDVVLPAGVEGIVDRVEAARRAEAVEYGQTLFVLAPFPSGEAAGHPPGLVLPSGSLAPAGGDAIPAGCFVVSSPIDGIFYRSPTPGAPAFVRPGDTVEAGRTLGLVEAMKSFNAVVYGAAGLPPRATLVETRAGDGAEVNQGAVLFVLRPA